MSLVGEVWVRVWVIGVGVLGVVVGFVALWEEGRLVGGGVVSRVGVVLRGGLGVVGVEDVLLGWRLRLRLGLGMVGWLTEGVVVVLNVARWWLLLLLLLGII